MSHFENFVFGVFFANVNGTYEITNMHMLTFAQFSFVAHFFHYSNNIYLTCMKFILFSITCIRLSYLGRKENY